MAAPTSPLRFGLELELHGIHITFKRKSSDDFWPKPNPNVKFDSTMIALNSILIPLDATNYSLPNGKINWESNWGFRGVGDAFANTAINGKDAINCILELATAAAQVDDHEYWTSSRLCAKKFVETMRDYAPNNLPGGQYLFVQDGARRWYPLQKFLADYNAKVESLPNRPLFVKNKFKLARSLGLERLAEGTYAGYEGEFWDAFVTCSSDPREQWCDVQVNYQMSLRTMDTRQDAWIGLWNSMWIESIGLGQLPRIDPQIGEIEPVKGVPSNSPYMVQSYAAMWRLARHLAHQHFAPLLPADAATDPLFFALITYVLAAGAVTIPQIDMIGSSTVKNAFPQLPKTSPASIAQALQGLRPNIVPVFQQLALPAGPRIALARNDTMNSLRNLAILAAPIPGSLIPNIPTNSPSPPFLGTFDTSSGGLIDGILSADFNNTWTGSFQPAQAPGPLNANGFQVGVPFFCQWALEVNSSLPAVVYNVGGSNEIKMLFESRYGRCKLNIGFNPYVRDCLFNRSYLSLVNVLGTIPEVARVAPAVTAAFPDDPLLQQNFVNGVH